MKESVMRGKGVLKIGAMLIFVVLAMLGAIYLSENRFIEDKPDTQEQTPPPEFNSSQEDNIASSAVIDIEGTIENERTIQDVLIDISTRLEMIDMFVHKGLVEQPEFSLTFDEARELTLIFDRYYRMIDLEPLEFNQTNVVWLIKETHVYFRTEGFNDEYTYPTEIRIESPLGGSYNILGGSNCHFLWISERLQNPFYQQVQELDWISVVIHEEGHVNQAWICPPVNDPALIPIDLRIALEQMAQVSSLEVHAAWANDGNLYGLKALLSMLRQTNLAIAKDLAESSGRQDEYRQLELDLGYAPNVVYRNLKAGESQLFLDAYLRGPWYIILEAYFDNGIIRGGAALPWRFIKVGTGPQDYRAVERRVRTGDLYYLLENLHQVMAWVENR